MIRAPLKQKGHILMDACTVHGTLHRAPWAKSHGDKAQYRRARKLKWGDIWYPHPKNKLQPVRYIKPKAVKVIKQSRRSTNSLLTESSSRVITSTSKEQPQIAAAAKRFSERRSLTEASAEKRILASPREQHNKHDEHARDSGSCASSSALSSNREEQHTSVDPAGKSDRSSSCDSELNAR